MPIYEYECLKCNKIFEELQSFSDKDITKCPHCKKAKVKKLISLSSFQLKGDGWYSTDYARKPKVSHTSPPSEGQDATKWNHYSKELAVVVKGKLKCTRTTLI